METLFEKAVIRIGIDTIRIKLENINLLRSDPMEKLVENLENSFDKNDISIFQKDGNHYVKDIDSNCYLAKIYKTGTDSCMIEIFGMHQTITEFKLTDYHRIILSVIGNIKNTLNTLEKIDVSLDFFYPHDRSFVFNRKKEKEYGFLDFLNYQIKIPFVHLTKMSMTTIRVPKSKKEMINFAQNHKDIKSQEDKKHKDCYYRWVKQEEPFLNWINYSRCEKSESSNFEIKINDREIFHAISNLFDGSETFSSDYDPETDIHIKRGSQKVSIIKYDKSIKDDNKHGCPIQDVYNAIIKDMADTDDEHDDLMDHFKHTRVELRFYQPAVSSRQNPLNLNLEPSYGELLECIKKKIDKMTIFILKPDISTDDYLDLYKKRLHQSSYTKRKILIERLASSGRVLEITDDEWNDFKNKINFLKSQFIKPKQFDIVGMVNEIKRLKRLNGS